MSTALDAALAHADAHLDDSVARLKTLVAIKSISTDPAYAGEGRKAADWATPWWWRTIRPLMDRTCCSTPITTCSRSIR